MLVRTFWQLCEMSEFHIVHEEPGANSTCLHAEIDQGGLESSRKVVFWMDPGVKVNECIGTNVSQVCL